MVAAKCTVCCGQSQKDFRGLEIVVESCLKMEEFFCFSHSKKWQPELQSVCIHVSVQVERVVMI